MNSPQSIDTIKLGERLRIARTAAQLTQEDVATRLSMARTTVVAIERGDRLLRPDELAAMSELYGVSTNSLLRGPAVHVDLAAQFRRGKGPKNEKAEAETVRLLHRLATGYVELEQRLGKPLVPQYPPERPLARRGLEQQAEDLALEIRTRFGLGTGPIVDLVGFLELELGVRVFVYPLDSRVAGAFAYHEAVGACIIVNAKHPAGRRAWTNAHELGHLLTRRNVASVLFVDEGPEKPPSEQFADMFANAFLMPGAAIRRAFSDFAHGDGRFTTRHLILLKHRFRVSLEAMSRRLEGLGLLKRGTYESLKERGLNNELVRQVLGSPDDDAPPTRPPRFMLLAAEAYSEDLLTEAQLAEMLVMSRVDVRALLDALGDDTDLAEGVP